MRAPPCSMYPGRSRTTRASQSRVQPRKSSNREMIPAVKPHSTTSCLRPDQEGRAGPAARVAHRDPVGRVEQPSSGYPVDGVDLGRVNHPDGRLLGPPAEDRVTSNLLGGSQGLGSSAKTSTPSARRPVSSSASRRAASRGVSPVDRPAGEGHLSGVGPHVVGAFGEQQVALLAEQQQHAPRRVMASSGGTNAVRSSGLIPRAARATGREPAWGSPSGPEVLPRGGGDVLLAGVGLGLDVGDGAPRVEEDRRRHGSDVGRGRARSSTPFGSDTSG